MYEVHEGKQLIEEIELENIEDMESIDLAKIYRMTLRRYFSDHWFTRSKP